MRQHCQACAQLVGSYNLYQCGRCKKHTCPRCLDPLVVAYCRECAVVARSEEIRKNLERMKR
jgi:hypothetical protein